MTDGRLQEACQTDVDGTSMDTMETIANQMGPQAGADHGAGLSVMIGCTWCEASVSEAGPRHKSWPNRALKPASGARPAAQRRDVAWRRSRLSAQSR